MFATIKPPLIQFEFLRPHLCHLSLFAEEFRREEEIQDEPTGKLHPTAVCTLSSFAVTSQWWLLNALPFAENHTFTFHCQI